MDLREYSIFTQIQSYSIMKKLLLACFFLTFCFAHAQDVFEKDIDAIEAKLIEWRRDFHENPELSNREFKTAEKIAKHLRSLGLEVQTNVAHTGVVAILKGDLPGKVLALRADIDALPVTERTDIPFKSTVKTTFNGVDTGVMHACGHDTHISILMGVAEIFSKHKDKIRGTIKFIFRSSLTSISAQIDLMHIHFPICAYRDCSG